METLIIIHMNYLLLLLLLRFMYSVSQNDGDKNFKVGLFDIY